MPNMPIVKVRPITLATEKPRAENSRSGQHGVGTAARPGDVRRHEQTGHDQRHQHAGRGPAVVVAVHDPPDARGRPRRRACAVPTRSSRCQVPFDSGTANSSSGSATRATGTLSQKMACQLTPSTTAPPTTGPSATPRPETPPQMPIAAARIFSGTAEASRVSDSGMIAAAPRPWTARAAISASEEVLSAEAIEARVKTVSSGDHHPTPAEPVTERRRREHEAWRTPACRRS